MWVVYALLSAVFAALTSILTKLGIANVPASLATAIRTAVVLVMAWSIVFLTGQQQELTALGSRNWLFLVISGCATGFSWIFYNKALQMGDVSKVVPIDKFSVVISMALAFWVLNEGMEFKTMIGGLLITAGTLVLIL